MNKVVSTRVIHNYKLKERRDYLENKLVQFDNVNFIEIEKSAPDFPEYLYSGGNLQNWRNKTKYLWQPQPVFRILSTPEIAATASHYYAYSSFDTKWCLILEDDALIPDDFKNKIQNIVENCPDQVDVVFIGGGFNLKSVSLQLGRIGDFVLCKHPATNTTVSYLVRKKCAIKLISELKHFDLPIDFELAFQMQQINVLVAHIQPYIVSEGSKSTYTSSIEKYRSDQ
jgi:GR25 family glycosyltransferase involved in LPS biosynthesis